MGEVFRIIYIVGDILFPRKKTKSWGAMFSRVKYEVYNRDGSLSNELEVNFPQDLSWCMGQNDDVIMNALFHHFSRDHVDKNLKIITYW